MFKKIFKKKSKENTENRFTLVAALLIHAAKIDENYTDSEKEIIKKAIMQLKKTDIDEANKIFLTELKSTSYIDEIMKLLVKVQ